MIFHGRLTESQARTRTLFDSGTRLWRVTRDPSRMFLNGAFRISDLQAGGFDKGTVFTHIDSGERRVVGAGGVLRRLSNKKEKAKRHKNRQKGMFVKPAKRMMGSGGANAIP